MRAKGLSRDDAFECLVDAGYDKTMITLYRQISQFIRMGYALLETSKVGRDAALSESQMDLLREWILKNNSENQTFDRRDLQGRIWDSWGLKVSLQTCTHILRRSKMSRKICQVKSSGFKVPNAEL